MAITEKRLSAIMASQASEDMFNAAKNSSLVKGKKRDRRPQKCYGVVLDRNIMSGVHRYDGVEADVGLPSLSVALPASAFQMEPSKCSLNVKGLAGTASKPPWYTTGPEGIAKAYADLALIRECSRMASPVALDFAWLSRLCAATHRVVMRPASCAGDDGWVFALHSWGDSAALVWPAKVERVAGRQQMVWAEPDLAYDDVMLVAVVDLEACAASTVTWRSPAWQFTHIPALAQRPAAIRGFFDGKVGKLHEVAARNAFWRLDSGFLHALASYLGIVIPPGSSMLQLILGLMQSILNITEGEALDLASRRVATTEVQDSFQQELMQVDDVHDCLDRHDVRVFQQEQQASKQKQGERQSFRKEYGEKVEQRRATEQPKKKARTNSRNKPTPSSSAPSRLPPLHTISQAEANKYAPPGG